MPMLASILNVAFPLHLFVVLTRPTAHCQTLPPGLETPDQVHCVSKQEAVPFHDDAFHDHCLVLAPTNLANRWAYHHLSMFLRQDEGTRPVLLLLCSHHHEPHTARSRCCLRLRRRHTSHPTTIVAQQ